MNILGGRIGRSQSLPLLASDDPYDLQDDRLSSAFDMPIIDAFAPPDEQDSIFSRL